MGDRVVLHIGTMKSGTSFIQSALMASPEGLADAGVEFLGGSFGGQSRAVRDLLRLPRRPRRSRARWLALAEQARAFEGHTAVVSMEFLSFAGPSHVGEFLEPLAGMEVQVVITVRDQFRAIPAQWQTYTRNTGTEDWPTYLRTIDPSRSGSGSKSRAFRTFHRAQDLDALLDRWGGRSEVSSVDVVTVPPPDAARDELWRRFCTATGIPDHVTDLQDLRENVSLGYASCDYLRRVNPHLADVAPRRYRKGMRPLARTVLMPLRDAEGKPGLDAAAAAFARSLNQRRRDSLSRGGYRIFGDLDDLALPEVSDFPGEAEAAPEEQVRRAATAVWDDGAQRVGGAAGTRPVDLAALVADSARLLRIVNGWDK